MHEEHRPCKPNVILHNNFEFIVKMFYDILTRELKAVGHKIYDSIFSPNNNIEISELSSKTLW